MIEVPRIISVDDHVVEPPDLWQSRLPARYRTRPRIGAQADGAAGRRPAAGRRRGLGRDRRRPVGRRLATTTTWSRPLIDAVGRRRLRRGRLLQLTTFDEIRPGPGTRTSGWPTWTPTTSRPPSASPTPCPGSAARPSSSARTRSSALLCVQAYNDWMIDEWCGRRRPRPAHPADHGAAVGRRAGGGRDPALRRQGQPRRHLPREPRTRSACRRIHDKDRFWDPFFAGLRGHRDGRLHAHRVVVEDADDLARRPVHRQLDPRPSRTPWGRCCDYLFSGTLERFPTLTIAYSEGQVGLDALHPRAGRQALGGAQRQQLRHLADQTRRRSYVPGRVYGCIFDDDTGLRNRDVIGMDQICFETDYPHADSTFPHSKETLDQDLRRGRAGRRGDLQARPGQRHQRPSASSASASPPERRGGQPRGSPRAWRARMFFWIWAVPP